MNRAWTNIALMAAVTWLLIGAALVPAFAQQPRRLEIERHPESGGLHLSWPLDAAGFQLETTDDLSTGGSWLPWPDQPQPIGNILSLVIQYGEASAYYRLRDRSGAELPPDPATVAPALDPVAVSDLGSSTRFLYAGAQPIQTGVAIETIVPRQAAVIRGKVSLGDGTALPGVTVSVLGHPELGRTLSREDGAYDLAVNGGERLTLCFNKTGFLAAQRAVTVPWQQYAFAPAVALVALDSNVTPVVLGAEAPAQVARGSVQTDQDGRAQHQMPDSSTIAMLCGADPRWGMQAPVLSQQIIRTPHGLSLTNATTRTIILASAQNPLALIRAEQRTAWNGSTFIETYTAAGRILIQRTPAGRVTTNRFDATGRVQQRANGQRQPRP